MPVGGRDPAVHEEVAVGDEPAVRPIRRAPTVESSRSGLVSPRASQLHIDRRNQFAGGMPPEGVIVDAIAPDGRLLWVKWEGRLWRLPGGAHYPCFTPEYWRLQAPAPPVR